MDECKGKVLYDTEFAATVAAAKVGHTIEEEMMIYPHHYEGHKRHWHIAHVDKRLRNKHLKEKTQT